MIFLYGRNITDPKKVFTTLSILIPPTAQGTLLFSNCSTSCELGSILMGKKITAQYSKLQNKFFQHPSKVLNHTHEFGHFRKKVLMHDKVVLKKFFFNSDYFILYGLMDNNSIIPSSQHSFRAVPTITGKFDRLELTNKK